MSQRTVGRVIGVFFLLAFVLYGGGSALAGGPAGPVLMLLNSVVVGAIGILAFRVLRPHRAWPAWLYLVARGLEAALLGAGVVLLTSGEKAANGIAYQLGMLALGLGSVPFFVALRRQRWVPGW